MNEQLLKDFIATAQKYNYDWNKTFGLFPELKSYDQQALKDYVATAEKYSYDYSKVNSLFPEFGFAAPQEELKKKEQPQPEPTAQAQPIQGAAQQAQAKPATALPSVASSSASSSAETPEDRGLTLLTPEFGKKVAQQEKTGAYFGSQAAPQYEKMLEGVPVVSAEEKKPKIKDETPKEQPYFTGTFGALLQAIDNNPMNQLGALGVGDFIDDIGRSLDAGEKQGALVTPANQLMVMGPQASSTQIRKYIDASKKMEDVPPSQEMIDFQKIYEEEGKGIFGFMKGVALNPSVLPQIMISSFRAMVNPTSASAGGAVVGGAAAGGAVFGGVGAGAAAAASIPYAMAAAGATLETGLSFSEFLKEKLDERGLEFNEENVKTILEDEKALSDIRTKSVARGATIGVVDALTGRLAGKVGAKLATGTAASKVKAGLVGAAIESVGGSTGEAAARAVSGQEMDTAEILFEGVSEAPMAVIDIAAEMMQKPLYKINGEMRSAKDVQDIIDNASAEDLQKINFDFKNDRNGFSEKIQDKIVTNEIRSEVVDVNPNLDEASIDELVSLEKQLRSYEGKKTQSSRDKVSEIKGRIREIQQAKPTEAAAEAAPAEDLKQKMEQELREALPYDYYEGNLKSEFDWERESAKEFLADPKAYFEKNIEVAKKNLEREPDNEIAKRVLEDNTEKLRIFNEITDKYKQDAIQKPSTEEGVLRAEQPQMGLQEVGQGDQGQVAAQASLQDQEVQVTQQINELQAALSDKTQDTITFGETTMPRAEAETQLTQLNQQLEGIQFEMSLAEEQVSSRTPQGVSVSNKEQLKGLASKTTNALKKNVIAAASRAVNTLKSVFPDMDIVIHETTDGFVSAGGNTTSRGNFQVTRDASGKIVKGVININLENANMSTVAHEVAHAVMLKAFGDNPALFKRFRDRINTILADTTIKQLDAFASEYSETDSHEEYLVELSAVLSANEQQLPTSVVQRIAELINKVVSMATKGALVPFKGTVETKQLIDFLNTMSSSIAKGQEIQVKEAKAKEGVAGITTKEQVGKEKTTTFAKQTTDNEGKQLQPESRGDRTGRYTSGSIAPLEGAPTFQGASGPDPRLVKVAEEYAAKNGINLVRQSEYVKVDVKRAKRIADAFEKMKHSPRNAKVREAYKDLIDQTKKQYQALIDAGYVFSFFDSKTDPYNGNPVDAMRDLRQNQKMAVYGTYDGYGTEGITKKERENNPMLEDTGFKWKDQNGVEHPVLANDLFRAVHDAFGHGLEGAGFRARGEENAWQAHVRLFTGPAVAAITTETRGQNSWLNYGPYGEKNRTAKVEDTVFADNKIGLMPKWTWTEGRASDMVTTTKEQVEAYHGSPYDFDKFTTKKMGTGEGAQAFGWGMYFTDVKEIARHYKEILAKPNFNKFRRVLLESGESNRVINDILDYSEYYNYDYNKVLNKLEENENTEAVNYLKRKKDLYEYREGKLYTVSLHEGKTPDQYTWLEWEKELTPSQIKNILDKDVDGSIQEALNKYYSEYNDISNVEELIDIIREENTTGERLYKILENYIGEYPSDKEASLALLRAGIDGIKYETDSLYRNNKNELKRGSNYVVFDENAVTIKTKEQRASNKEAEDLVKRGRANGISEGAIRNVLTRRGFTPEQIDAAMAKPEAAGKTKVEETFAEGFDRLMREIEGIIKKSTYKRRSQEDILDNVLNYIIGSKLYENATDVQREQMIRDARKRFGKREKSAPKAETILGEVTEKITIAANHVRDLLIKSLARGAKDAKRAWVKASKALATELEEMVNGGKITSKQMVAIIKRFANVDMFNEASIESFVNYMKRVLTDAEYAEKIAGIKSKLKTARKNIFTKLGVSKNLIPELESMLAINPTLIPEDVFNEYIELVDMLSKREAVLKLDEVNSVMDKALKVLNAVAAQESKAAEMYQRYTMYGDKVIKDDKEDFAATLKKMVEEGLMTEEEAEILRKYNNKFIEREGKAKTEQEKQEEREQALRSLESVSVTATELPSRMERDAATELIALAKTDAVDGLDNAELKNLLKALDNIQNGYFPHQAQLLLERLNGIKNSKPLAQSQIKAKPLKATQIYAKIKSIITRGGRSAMEEMARRNPLKFIDQVFGDFKSQAIFKSLFEPMASAYDRFHSGLKAVESRLDEAYNGLLKSHGGDALKALMSSYRVTAYMVQNEFNSNQGNKQVNKASDFLKATIKKIYAGNTHLSEKNAQMLEEVLNWVNSHTDADGNVDVDAMYSSMTPAERNVAETVREINDGLSEKAMYTASVIRGEKIKPLGNYVHLQVMRDYNPEDNVINESESLNYSEARKPSSKAKNLVERTGEVSPINFDIFSSAQRGARFVLLDYHMTPAIRTGRKTLVETKNRLMNEDGIIRDKKTRDVNTAIEKVFEEVVRNTLSNTFTVNSFAEEVVNYISKTGYRAVLAGVPRFASELTSNMAFATIIDPSSFKKGFQLRGISMSAMGADVMTSLGSTQISRIYSADPLTGKLIDTQILSQSGGRRMGRATSDVANKLQQIYNNSLKKYKNGVEFVADTLIATPDRMVMRAMWFGSFSNEFKNITGVEPDFDKIAANDEAYMNENKEALKEATSAADTKSILTGAAENPFVGILKGAPTPNQSGFTKAFNIFNNYMTRFLIYEYMTARQGIMAAMGNGYLTKKQGAAMLGAVVTRMTLYSFMISTLTQVMVGMFVDDEDEDDEKSLLQKFGQSFTSGVTGLIFGRDFGNATKAIVNYGVEKANQEYLDFLREGEYDPYKDAIAFTPIPMEPVGSTKSKEKGLTDLIVNMMGPYTPAMKSAQFIYKKAFGEPKKTPEAIERERKEMQIRIPLEVLGNLGLLPLYKDVRKVTLAELYKDIDKASKQSEEKKAQEELDKPPHGLTMEEYKRYFPEDYEKRYGENSEYRKRKKKENTLKDAKNEAKKKMLDEFYNYQPKKANKGFGSKGFGGESENEAAKKKSTFGSKKFGEQ